MTRNMGYVVIIVASNGGAINTVNVVEEIKNTSARTRFIRFENMRTVKSSRVQ